MVFNMNFPGLKGVEVTKVEGIEEKVVIQFPMQKYVDSRPSCGELTEKVHDYRIQKVKHLKWFERLSVLFNKRRRYVCTACG